MAAQLHFGTGDSITFGTAGTASSMTASFSKSALGNMVIGDLLVAWIHDQSSSSGTITAPSGWTNYGAAIGTPSLSVSRNSGFYYYALKAQSDIDALASTLTWSFSASGGRVACVVARATGIDLNTIVDSAATAFTSGNGLSLSIGGITTVNATTLLVGGLHHQNSASTTSPNTTSFLTAFQEYKTSPDGSTNANTGAALAYQYLTSAGATGSVVASFDNATTAAGGELVAFKAGAWSPPPPAGKAIKYTSALNTLATGQAYYTSASDTLAVPAEVRAVPTGYSSVTSMLATSPFYVAHRGGSVDWPEMSLHAYTQSVFWGVGAVELSLARTSDGIWFGLHDASLDRTSLNTGGGSGTTLVAANMTWAQVQQYQINYPSVTNSASLPKPYMRWEEIMAAYYGTHIIFVDPKAAYSNYPELLNMMDAQPGTPTSHFVAKYYGVVGPTNNSSGWPHDASARGYKGWGYFYEADFSNVPTYQGRWDILGMDYNATQTSWTQILSYGKPVIGHIVPNPTAATTALNFGASGLMVSGVQEVITRTPNAS